MSEEEQPKVRVKFSVWQRFTTIEGTKHFVKPGDIVELPKRSADHWIASGHAEEVKPDAP